MGRIRSLLIPGVDKKLLIKDAAKLMPDLSRRRFIASGASLGALTFLTGCDVSDSVSAEKLLTQISKFNDGVQAAIFNPNTLAPTYSEKDITRQAARGETDHPPHLRGGLERDRQLVGHSLAGFSQPGRRRYLGEICLVPLRRGLY